MLWGALPAAVPPHASPLLVPLQVKLWQVGRLLPPKLAAHMEESGCLPVLYMSAWLLTVFASAFPLAFASRVMDVLLTDSYSEPMMKVGSHPQQCCHVGSVQSPPPCDGIVQPPMQAVRDAS